MNLAIGIDIGGTNTKVGIVQNDGSTVENTLFSTKDYSEFDLFIKKLTTEINDLLNNNNLKIKDLIGIGIGVPNGNYEKGLIENPTNLKYWGTQDIVSPLKKVFDTNILLDNDANIAAFGEKIFGKAQNLNDFIVVTLGTGVGTGIFVNGSLVRGSNGLASEGGHIKIFDNSRICGCGGSGHLESYASISGIKLTAKELTGIEYRYREIVDLYHKKDPKILEVINQFSKQLAHGLSVMGCLFAPKKIILAGGVTIIGDEFLKDLLHYYDSFIYPPFKNTTSISISNISREKGAFVAAASIIFNHFT